MEFQIERIVKNIVGNEVESFKVIELVQAEAHDGSIVTIKSAPQNVNQEGLLRQKEKMTAEIINLQRSVMGIDKLLSDISTLKTASESAVVAPIMVKDA